MYLLDTNIISEMRMIPKNKANLGVELWFKHVCLDDLFISSIVLLELKQGILKAYHQGDEVKANALNQWFEQKILPTFAQRILPITDEIALKCAELHIPNERDRHDALIGATALVHDLTLVTRNTKDFNGIEGLRLLNPFH